MARSTVGTFLPDDDWNRLQEIADRFAEARRNGPVDDWEAYLPAASDSLRRPALMEFIKIDLEATWKEEGRALVETYETLFPEISPPPVDLIVEEYRIRHRLGDRPDISEYQSRFPDQYAEFEQRAKERPPQQTAPKVPKQEPPPESLPTPPLHSLFPPGYHPIEQIGRGNFGEVWRAEAPGGIAVAVKIVSQPLDNEAAQRELQSLELVKKLQHPALLSTLAFWVIQNRLVIVMELADCTLRDRLKACQAKGLPGIPGEELLSYFRDAAVGLDWLHWQGVLHRDIKPENILLKQGYAKVADFGLARAHTTNAALMSVSFAGTPAFMAPELWAGKANKNSDQYSLAFTYAELRLGRRPLGGGDFVQVMTSAIEGVPDLTGLPDVEQTVLRRALAKKPEDRFDSCQDFVDALDRALHPDGRTSRRRPASHIPATAADGSAGGIASTERTERKTEPPKRPKDSTDQTFHQESVAAPKKPDVVWKPLGAPNGPVSSAASGGAAKTILIAIVGLVLLGAVVTGTYLMFFRGNGPVTTASAPTATVSAPITTSKPIKTTKLEVEPEKPVVLAGFSKAEKSAIIEVNAKKYPERLVFRPGLEGETFLKLLRPETGNPFYIAEDKGTNALVQSFVNESADRLRAWKNDGAMLPAMNVTWDEAQRIAKWMKGDLPTPAQLDFAAGFTRRDNRPGPATGNRVAVKITRPLPVNRTETDDVSPLGVRDLAGNGREWTRSRIVAGEPMVILRGRMYTLPSPVTYEQLAWEQDEKNAQVQRPGVPSPQTGFRIVCEFQP